jgi:hypothetical protein
LHRDACPSVGVLARLDDPNLALLAKVFWQVGEGAIDVVGDRYDVMLLDLVSFAVFFDVFGQTLFIRYFEMVF